MARQAYDWLSLAPLFLDTETTGLDNTAEASEIGLTDAAGQVVFETVLKPTVAIGRRPPLCMVSASRLSAAHHHGQMWRGNCVMQSGTDQ